MRKIGTLLLTVLLLNLLMAAGLVGFVVATGRLDGAKAQVIVDLVRHRGAPADLRKQVAALLEPAVAATEPAAAATQGGVARAKTEEGALAAVASAADRIEYARQAMEQERLRLDREAQDLQHRQDLLETQRQEVEGKLAAIAAEKKKFAQEVGAAEAKAKDANFTRSLAFYAELKPKQVKDLFLNLNNPDLVAQYLKAMEQEQATAIIGEFKNPKEREYIGGVLERIRGAGTASAIDPGTPATRPASSAPARS